MGIKRFRVINTLILVGLIGLLLLVNSSTGKAEDDSSSPGEGGNSPLLQTTPEVPMLIPTPLPTERPPINSFGNSAKFSFADLGVTTFVMELPSAFQVPLDLPNQWALASSADVTFIELHYDLYYDPPTAYELQLFRESAVMPVMAVYVDGYLARTFSPKIGKNQVDIIPFPFEALRDLATYYTQNDHVITFEFKDLDTTYCSFSGMLQVHDDSFVNLGFIWKPAAISLSDFPRPLIQESFLPEVVYIILPDEYSDHDLSAAMAIINKTGRNTLGNVQFKIVKASEVDNNLLKASSAIVIGTPRKNSFTHRLLVNGLTPLSLSNNKIVWYGNNGSATVADDEGVLALVPSDTNQLYTYLVVTGATDEAVLNGANGLANLPSVGLTGSLAIISPELLESKKEEAQAPSVGVVNEIASFSSMGLTTDITMVGRGKVGNSVEFYVPMNWEMQENAQLVVLYEYSINLSLINSNVTVRLNDRPIGALPIKELTQGTKQVVIPLDRNYFLPGRVNTFAFNGILASELECANWDRDNYWINIQNSSSAFLPHKIITDVDNFPKYPHPFDHLAYADNILFVLPSSPRPEELNGLANFIFRVSTILRLNQAINYRVIDQADYDPVLYADYQIIAIGRPSTNQVIQLANDALPQSFVPGEDSLLQRGGEYAYRIPKGVDVGLIEVTSAPWNRTKGLTVITGTSDQAVDWSLRMISDRTLPIDWNGDLYFINENLIQNYDSSVIDIKPLNEIVSGVVQDAINLEYIEATITPVVAEEVAAEDESFISNMEVPVKNKQLTASMVGVIVVAGLGLIVLIIAGIRISRGGRRS